MAEVKMDALFPASAHVKLYERKAGELSQSQFDVLAHASVGQDSKLTVAGLEAGSYWAVVDGSPPVAVTAKGLGVTRDTEDRRTRGRPTGDGDVISAEGDGNELESESRDAADTLVSGDPKSQEAPASGRDIVTGPRTSGNTRLKSQGEAPRKSLTETVKGAVKKGKK